MEEWILTLAKDAGIPAVLAVLVLTQGFRLAAQRDARLHDDFCALAAAVTSLREETAALRASIQTLALPFVAHDREDDALPLPK